MTYLSYFLIITLGTTVGMMTAIIREQRLKIKELKMSIKIKPLIWSIEKSGNETCSYDHVRAETPLGEFLITWKSWKERPSYDIQAYDDGKWLGSEYTLELAKEFAEIEYQKKIMECLDV